MKNNYIMFTAALLLLFSCTKQVETPMVSLSLDITGATAARVGLDADSHTYWSSGDKATVFYHSSKPTLWTYSGEDGAYSGQLKYMGNPFVHDEEKTVAMMPYDASARLEGDEISFTLPSEQVVSSEGGASPVLVASSLSDALTFDYATALVKLTLKGYGTLSSLTLKGNNDEILCGNATVDMSDSQPCVRLASGASGKSLRVSGKDGAPIANMLGGKADLYVSVPEMTFANGFIIEAEYSRGGKQIIKHTDQANLYAGRVYDLGEVSACDEIVIELDFSHGKAKAADCVAAIKKAYGVDFHVYQSTNVITSGSYKFNIEGNAYDIVMGYCPDTDLSSSRGFYIGESEGSACLMISTNGWYMAIPKIENHVLYWFSCVAGKNLTTASSTEYFVTTDVSTSRGNAKNHCVSDRLTAPQTVGQEYVSYVGDADTAEDYYLTQYAGGWLYMQKICFGYRRVK